MANKTILTKEDKQNIIQDYTTNNLGIYAICAKYKIGKIKLKNVFAEYNVPIKKVGGQLESRENDKVTDTSVEKYKQEKGYHYVAISKHDGTRFSDYNNVSGCLTSYINKKLGIEIPSAFLRRKYYRQTGNYWHEQWFDIVKEKTEIKEVKRCPYCGWITIDVNNRSGVFEQHLKNQHQISVEEHLKNHPEDKEYFTSQANSVRRKIHEYDKNNYVVCQICGAKLTRIDWQHLDKHGITLAEYKMKYGMDSTMSNNYRENLVKNAIKLNLALEQSQDKFTSKAEMEIKDFIQSLGIECGKNRSVLDGKELDIFIPSHNLAIEFNGNIWHTETFGHKPKDYHINKLNACNAKGIKLIQIFEDEYEYHKTSFKIINSNDILM